LIDECVALILHSNRVKYAYMYFGRQGLQHFLLFFYFSVQPFLHFSSIHVLNVISMSGDRISQLFVSF